MESLEKYKRNSAEKERLSNVYAAIFWGKTSFCY